MLNWPNPPARSRKNKRTIKKYPYLGTSNLYLTMAQDTIDEKEKQKQQKEDRKVQRQRKKDRTSEHKEKLKEFAQLKKSVMVEITNEKDKIKKQELRAKRCKIILDEADYKKQYMSNE